MKKGFTIIEVLVVVAIIGILSSVVLASISKARSMRDAKIPAKTFSDVGRPAVAAVEDNYCSEAMAGPDGCGCIPNLDARRECEDGAYKSKMIQECVQRYSN